ncbi:MAG: MFS transporter [Roseiflexaceae bacterium]
MSSTALPPKKPNLFAERWKQSTFVVLENLDYRQLLTGTVIWWQCFFMEMVVMGWLVFDLSNSTRMVSLVAFCRTLPLLLVSFFSGPIIDAIGRRRVIVAAQTINLAAYTTIGLLLWSGQAAIWNIALIAFCIGSAWALDWPTRRSLVPDLLGKERVVDGLLLESFITGIARIIAPTMAGWLIAHYGALGCYLVMALLATMALASLWPLLQHAEPRKGRVQFNMSLPLEGLRYVRTSQPILAVLLITLILNLWIFPYISLLPTFARDILHKGPVELGFLNTATGIGSFLGLLTLNFLRQRVSVGLLFVGGTTWMCLALIAFARSHSYPFSWGMLFCAGMGMACFGTLQSTIILMATTDDMRSRVMSLLVLAIGGDPLGQIQIGTLAELIGVQGTLAGQASAALLIVLVIVWSLRGVLQPTDAAKQGASG